MSQSHPVHYRDRPHHGASRKVTWVRVTEGLPRGVLLCHETMVGGWRLRTELVMTAVGSLQLRVNGQNYGEQMIDCTLSGGRKHYERMLKQLTRPRQLLLPL